MDFPSASDSLLAGRRQRTRNDGRQVPANVLRGATAAENNEGLYHSYEVNVLAGRATTLRGSMCSSPR